MKRKTGNGMNQAGIGDREMIKNKEGMMDMAAINLQAVYQNAAFITKMAA